MISSYLYDYLGSEVITGKKGKEGNVLVDGAPSGMLWLRQYGVLELGPLNTPIGPYLKFDDGAVSRSVKEPPYESWERVPDDEINEGLHLFLLLDPRTYDKIDNIVDEKRSQIFSQPPRVFILATYPVEAMLKELKVPEKEFACVVDMLGQWWQTSFSFGQEEVQMFVRDPLFAEGVVIQLHR